MTNAGRICGVFGGLCFVILPTAHAQPAATAPVPPASQPGKVVQFQPNLRIDYGKRQVEADGKVVLREGLLELFACSPGTREYESIVVLNTRPVFIFQALGLLGLEPGHPLRMDPKTAQIIPASGDSVEIEVRYELNGIRKAVPIESWMRLSQTKAPLEQQAWVFAGSFPVERGGISADEEGTIVAVVDFESALIALPRLHTASNAELWLEPKTEAIPPVGTACTLIFRPGPLAIRLDGTGRLYVGGKAASYAEAARKLRQFARENPTQPVEVTVSPDSPADDREQLKALMEELRIEVRRRTASQPAATVPSGEEGTLPDNNDRSSSGDPKAVPRWLSGLLRKSSSTATPDDPTAVTSQPDQP